jgi:hypothetical protein
VGQGAADVGEHFDEAFWVGAEIEKRLALGRRGVYHSEFPVNFTDEYGLPFFCSAANLRTSSTLATASVSRHQL